MYLNMFATSGSLNRQGVQDKAEDEKNLKRDARAMTCPSLLIAQTLAKQHTFKLESSAFTCKMYLKKKA